MQTLTEGDSRPKAERNSSRKRGNRRVGAAHFARFARSLFCATFLLSALAACSADGVTGPAAPKAPALKLLAGQPQLDVIGDPSGEKIPIEATEPNTCHGGELVPFRGHMALTAFTSDGDVFHQRFQMHYVFDGTGTLGNVYHGSATHSTNLNISLLPLTYTEHHQVRMTSRTAPDMIVTMKFHMTITPSGRVVSVDKGPATECRT